MTSYVSRTEQEAIARSVRAVLQTETNRRFLQELLNLKADPRLPAGIASLLETLNRTNQESH
jgi:hypothetical protein